MHRRRTNQANYADGRAPISGEFRASLKLFGRLFVILFRLSPFLYLNLSRAGTFALVRRSARAVLDTVLRQQDSSAIVSVGPCARQTLSVPSRLVVRSNVSRKSYFSSSCTAFLPRPLSRSLFLPNHNALELNCLSAR